VKRVLIVEDQADIRDLIRMSLEHGGYEIHEAEDGDQGLQMARRLAPDLILLDVMMPGNLDGLAVCKHLKADPLRKRTKVVMLSAKNLAADKQAGLSAGADAYLVKPFSPRQLLQSVAKVI
jgi:CheY-like chemotaxis protein